MTNIPPSTEPISNSGNPVQNIISPIDAVPTSAALEGAPKKRNDFPWLFGILVLVVGALFLFQRSKTEEKTGRKFSEQIDFTEPWNGSGNYDSNLFSRDRYSSGDVYLASCFESAVPNNFEITAIGLVPRIGVVKPIGVDVEGNYFPFIDIRFHENSNDITQELLTKKNYAIIEASTESLTGGGEVINKKVSFEKIKLYRKTSNAIVVTYDFPSGETIVNYDGKKIDTVSGVNVFVMGDNPKIIENFKLWYETSQKERDIKLLKNFLKTFEPTCYAKHQ